MRYDKQLFRCSALGYLMTEPKAKAAKEAGELSEGAITHLIDIFISERYGRNTDISNKYIQKGLMVEEDSITLYSRYKKAFFKKNEQHLNNAYIQGTPDLFIGSSIQNADEIIDVKSSWDIYTFFRNRFKPINPLYFWQLQGYMALTGVKMARLAYCLVDTPESLIADEIRKLGYRMNTDSKEWEDACFELSRSMRFEDIPLDERIIEYEIERDEEAISMLYAKIGKARQHLNNLHRLLSSTITVHDNINETKITIHDKI